MYVSLVFDKEDISRAQLAIKEIESGISKSGSIIHKMFSSKRDTIRYLADQYEILAESDTLQLQKKQIANFLMKRIKVLDANIGTAWVYDSLPQKYKTHRLNQTDEFSTEWNENSSLDVNYNEENKLEINFLTSYINLLKQRRTALKNESFYSKLEPEEYREHYIIRNTALNMLENAWNNRKTVPVNTIHLLLESFDKYNLKYAAGHYISLLKKFGSEKKDDAINKLETTFSDKQLRKILKGHTRELHSSWEIQTQDEAYANGFYGKRQCNECSSWRIIQNSSYNPKTGKFSKPTLYCFACGNTDRLPKVKLPLSTGTPRITEEKEL